MKKSVLFIVAVLSVFVIFSLQAGAKQKSYEFESQSYVGWDPSKFEEINNGRLFIESKKEKIYWSISPVNYLFKEKSFDLTTKCKLAQGSSGYCGLIFGYRDSDNYYILMVNPMAGWFYWGLTTKGNWGARGERSKHGAVKDGDNRLSVKKSDKTIELFVNDTKVKTLFQETNYKGGKVGLVAGGDVKASFDYFDLVLKD